VVVTFRSNRLGSAAAWVWNLGQDLWALSLPALIVLKLTGVIGWSWWWVLSPMWVSGILLAPVLWVLLVLLGWHMFRRAASGEELAAALSQDGTRAARARPPVLPARPCPAGGSRA